MSIHFVTHPEDISSINVLAYVNLTELTSSFHQGKIDKPDFGDNTEGLVSTEDYQISFDIWLDDSGYYYHASVAVTDLKSGEYAYAYNAIANENLI